MKKVILIENEDEVILCTKEKSAVNVKCNNGVKVNIKMSFLGHIFM